MKKHNFGAGPCILPQSIFEQTANAVLDLNKIGLSLLEISHRSDDYDTINNTAIALIKELLNVPDNYKIMFLTGGASTQFAMVPYNLLPPNGKALYVETGVWASKAFEEAGLYGNAEIIASSKDKTFSYIPKQYEIDETANYLHITTNNTIYGTEMFELPNTNIPIVADMSSDIFSRKIDVSKYGLIYAGAQKNSGTAGITIVIIREDLLKQNVRKKSSIWDYQIHAKNNSIYNTPPVFAVYVCMLTLQWLKNLGGVEAIEKINIEKANLLYNEIDRNTLFKGFTTIEDRSRMNVTFTGINEDMEKQFANFAKEKGMHGIEGHRTTGGFRASLYNALPLESVQALVDTMQAFEKIVQ